MVKTRKCDICEQSEWESVLIRVPNIGMTHKSCIYQAVAYFKIELSKGRVNKI